jgi:hypothetical protein
MNSFVHMSRPAEARTMFFKPLAYPSTLDHRQPVALADGRRPTWRSFGARATVVGEKIAS